MRGVSGKHVDVEMRGKRMRVPLSDLRARRRQSRREPRTGPSAGIRRRVGNSAPRPRRRADARARPHRLDGRRGASTRAEKFLDDALLTDERRLRVVHGHGTGRLREALRTFFREHPLVASVAPAPDNEGGDGATIVELKD